MKFIAFALYCIDGTTIWNSGIKER